MSTVVSKTSQNLNLTPSPPRSPSPTPIPQAGYHVFNAERGAAGSSTCAFKKYQQDNFLTIAVSPDDLLLVPEEDRICAPSNPWHPHELIIKNTCAVLSLREYSHSSNIMPIFTCFCLLTDGRWPQYCCLARLASRPSRRPRRTTGGARSVILTTSSPTLRRARPSWLRGAHGLIRGRARSRMRLMRVSARSARRGQCSRRAQATLSDCRKGRLACRGGPSCTTNRAPLFLPSALVPKALLRGVRLRAPVKTSLMRLLPHVVTDS